MTKPRKRQRCISNGRQCFQSSVCIMFPAELYPKQLVYTHHPHCNVTSRHIRQVMGPVSQVHDASAVAYAKGIRQLCGFPPAGGETANVIEPRTAPRPHTPPTQLWRHQHTDWTYPGRTCLSWTLAEGMWNDSVKSYTLDKEHGGRFTPRWGGGGEDSASVSLLYFKYKMIQNEVVGILKGKTEGKPP